MFLFESLWKAARYGGDRSQRRGEIADVPCSIEARQLWVNNRGFDKSGRPRMTGANHAKKNS